MKNNLNNLFFESAQIKNQCIARREKMIMEYVVEMRRKLHEYPEIGFELPRTLELVRGELERFGVEYTEKYGKSSIVGILNPEKTNYTIGIRADMDALPILEKNDVPYKSKIDGQMHACGHDAHTAILLDTVRKLSEIKDEINCRVMFVFQASEEAAPGGAHLMVNDGLMDEIDCIVALHVSPAKDKGVVALIEGPRNSISNGFHLHFYGKSAHVASQEKGVDAIIMACKAIIAIEMMLAKEIGAKECCFFNIGAIEGGKTQNVISDHCYMQCTLRSWDEATDRKVEERIRKIIAAVAMESGGKSEFVQVKHTPYVNNDIELTKRVKSVIASVIGEENVVGHNRGMGAEDFSHYGKCKPACMFNLGVRNESKGYTSSIHQDTFMLDEDALSIGSDIFVEFVKKESEGK